MAASPVFETFSQMSQTGTPGHMIDTPVGFIGAGQMARALGRGFVVAELLAPEQMVASDPNLAARRAWEEAIPGAVAVTTGSAVVAASEIIFLAVKPQYMPAVFQELAAVDCGGKLWVSIAAGVKVGKLISGLKSERVIRVMPNTPALVGKGASAFCCGPSVVEDDAMTIQRLLEAVGCVVRVDQEELIDAVTGLSGSGPAFVYQFIEALSDGGVQSGLPRDVAQRLATQTVLGAASMVAETGEHPAVLKDRVASPAGTTIAGLGALEQGGLRAAVISAVRAASDRSRELGRG